MKRPTEMLKAVHDEAIRRPWQHWVYGALFFGWGIYRVETHRHSADDRWEHVWTVLAFALGAAVTPYVKEGVIALVRGLAPFLPFGRAQNGNGRAQNGNGANDTLSGRGGRSSEPK